MKKRQQYIKPTLTKKKLKLSFFMTSSRFFDSFDQLLIPKAYASFPCDNCFLAGTKILLADGSEKNIELITRGETVFSMDTTHKKKTSESVTETITHLSSPDGYMIINDVLKVTPNHIVWSKDTWTQVGLLHVGDALINSIGKSVVIKKISYKKGTFDVYNLELDGPHHNFFAEDVLVHNQKK